MTKTKRAHPGPGVHWGAVARDLRSARASLSRICDGLAFTETATVQGRWAQLRRGVEWARSMLDDMAGGVLPNQPDWTREELEYYGWPQPDRRQLDRAEWVQLGGDVKRARECLARIGLAIQAGVSKPQARRWFAFADTVSHLKGRLEVTAARQHRGWSDVTRVFYGPPTPEPEAAPASELAEVPFCGYRPESMPEGWRDLHVSDTWIDMQTDDLPGMFAAWVREQRKAGAVYFLAKAAGFDKDGRPT